MEPGQRLPGLAAGEGLPGVRRAGGDGEAEAHQLGAPQVGHGALHVVHHGLALGGAGEVHAEGRGGGRRRAQAEAELGVGAAHRAQQPQQPLEHRRAPLERHPHVAAAEFGGVVQAQGVGAAQPGLERGDRGHLEGAEAPGGHLEGVAPAAHPHLALPGAGAAVAHRHEARPDGGDPHVDPVSRGVEVALGAHGRGGVADHQRRGVQARAAQGHGGGEVGAVVGGADLLEGAEQLAARGGPEGLGVAPGPHQHGPGAAREALAHLRLGPLEAAGAQVGRGHGGRGVEHQHQRPRPVELEARPRQRQPAQQPGQQQQQQPQVQTPPGHPPPPRLPPQPQPCHLALLRPAAAVEPVDEPEEGGQGREPQRVGEGHGLRIERIGCRWSMVDSQTQDARRVSCVVRLTSYALALDPRRAFG
ncbi:hypothetical protein Mterra_03445 [Calidithermus terrae]|uniref:Uncharacterized protein n=1 Tax=Calidithermus terrae TaxID=1408545 RepID=A0A399E8T2_9DEIN|nr:hypothetical protein Mterra_03445 [Calidithermus terrae]